MNIYLDTTLEHAGVKGMKWGVRKAVKRIGRGIKRMDDRYADSKYDQYRKDGFDDTTAQKKTNRAVRVNRAVVGLSAAGALAAGAYFGKRAYDFNFKDVILKKGDSIQTILSTDKVSMDRPVYGVKRGTRDSKFYKGFITKHLENQGVSAKDVYSNTIRFDKDTKIASRRAAKKVFDDLYKKDKDFVKSLGRDYMGGVGGRFDNFNSLIPTKQGDSYKKMVSELKKRGYSGMVDVNDYKRSTARNPIIVFENNSNARQTGWKNIQDHVGTKKATKDYVNIYGQRVGIQLGGKLGAAIVGRKALDQVGMKLSENDIRYDRKTGKRKRSNKRINKEY